MANPEEILHMACWHLLAKENNQDNTPETGDALEILGDALEELMEKDKPDG